MYGLHTYGSATYGSGPLDDPPEPGVGASLRLNIRVSMVEAADIALPIRVSMVTAQSIALGLRVSMVEARDIVLPVWITMVDAAVTSPAKWTVVATLDGQDISERLTEDVIVEGGEGEAKLANFAMAPAPGTILLPNWTGKTVTIDVAHQATDGSAINPRRIFTGVVDEPEIDLSEGVVRFECTDQAQQVIRNLPREWVDANVGGYYSAAIFGETTDTLQYADARISTVPATLELDAFQQPRVTPWYSEDDPLLVLTDDDIWDGTLIPRLAPRGDILNEIEGGVKYRFPRLRARVVSVDFERTVNQYTSQGLDIPNRAMIEQAVTGMSGWELLGDINYVAVDPGQYESSGSGGTIFTTISITDAPKLALGFAARFANRWVQWVTENYRVTVRSQASIDAIGRAPDTRDGATLDTEFDDGAWQGDPDAAPALTLPTSGDVSLDYGAAGKSDRPAAQNAIATAVAQMKREVLGSHRKSSIEGSMPFRADIDLSVRLEIDTTTLHATGKVSRFRHRLSIETGEADTDFTLAVSGFSAVGLQDDDAPDAPAAPTDPTPAPGADRLRCEFEMYIGQVTGAPEYDPNLMFGLCTNARAGADFDAEAPAYPYELSIRSPEVEAAVRDPIELPKAATYAVAIPQDILEIINP
ncbi:hypothetical protein [Methyloversatilis discipulorum]|uniref:hypothetical protein n=1 Tax=Methyloversatilis discipulorum TaxID=1119528 RepID=UPI00313821FD